MKLISLCYYAKENGFKFEKSSIGDIIGLLGKNLCSVRYKSGIKLKKLEWKVNVKFKLFLKYVFQDKKNND